MGQKRKKILLLGGTSEASQLVHCLQNNDSIEVIFSLAGVTKNPVLPRNVISRVGGFGGVTGLIMWLKNNQIDFLIDATHPFALQMTNNAWKAAKICGIPFLNLQRPAWQKRDGDHWYEVNSIPEAVKVLGHRTLRVFLTIGRKDILLFKENIIQHHYWIRSVDKPDDMVLPSHAEVITARGPFDVQSEYDFLKQYHIECIVTKNSGGQTVYAKIDAARKLSIPVIMIQRPVMPQLPSVSTMDKAYQWLMSHLQG